MIAQFPGGTLLECSGSGDISVSSPAAASGSDVVVIAERPHCSGEWLSGSGGHRVHAPCDRAADWFHPDDLFAYCASHLADSDRGMYLPWSQEGTCQ